MERYIELYRQNPLFAGVEETQLLSLLDCLQAQKRTYPKGALLFSAGTAVTQLGIILSGRINTVYEDLLGGRSIIGSMEAGQLFCDAFSCARNPRLPVSVVAQTDSVVLLIDHSRILHTCSSACRQHQILIENLVQILAEKYVALNRKVIHLSGRSTRRKLLSYLSEQLRISGGKPFVLPFNQQELADYLFIDRSGLSTEWNRMKKDGILELQNDLITLHIPPCAGRDCDEAQEHL